METPQIKTVTTPKPFKVFEGFMAQLLSEVPPTEVKPTVSEKKALEKQWKAKSVRIVKHENRFYFYVIK